MHILGTCPGSSSWAEASPTRPGMGARRDVSQIRRSQAGPATPLQAWSSAWLHLGSVWAGFLMARTTPSVAYTAEPSAVGRRGPAGRSATALCAALQHCVQLCNTVQPKQQQHEHALCSATARAVIVASLARVILSQSTALIQRLAGVRAGHRHRWVSVKCMGSSSSTDSLDRLCKRLSAVPPQAAAPTGQKQAAVLVALFEV